jgi:hypothetical protein
MFVHKTEETALQGTGINLSGALTVALTLAVLLKLLF